MFGLKKAKKLPLTSNGVEDLVWYADRFSCYRDNFEFAGWVFHKHKKVVELLLLLTDGSQIPIPVNQPSGDVQAAHGGVAKSSRFAIATKIPNPEDILKINFVCVLEDGQHIELPYFVTMAGNTYAHQVLFSQFKEKLHAIGSGKLLEIGSRNRSGNIRKEICPENMEYTGFDIMEGENVDVVGDAHKLSSLFPENHFDAIFSVSVFEHLAMPWKVALEKNKILKPGGLVFIQTHQAWPVHEEPWDFWRFSKYSWATMFNKHTGFEIIDAVMSQPCELVAQVANPSTIGFDHNLAYLCTAMMARKISDTDLSWDVGVEDITADMYPQ